MALKGRKSSTKNPPFFSHEFVIQNHADIVSCFAMIFVVGLMVQVTSPLAYMFIAVHHNVSSEQQSAETPDVTRFTYGYKDICAVFFYFLICIVMHAIIQEYVLDKISRKLHLSKVKHSKFNESGQLLVFYVMSVLWGGDAILKENLVLNISSLWEGYPHNEMTFMFKFFFIIQMSYWLHCYPELYFQRTKREEMFPRVLYATVGLVYVAAGYLLNFNRVAICLLVIHYFSEALFHVARLVDFVDKEEKGSKAGYLVSDVFFVLARLASIILSVLTFWYGLSLSDTQGLDLADGNFNIPPIRLFALGAVCLLQAYLMFHFITDKLRQLREQAPSVQTRKLPAKKTVPKKKKDESKAKANSAIDDTFNEMTEVDQNTKKSLRSRTVKTK
ncbi:translocating chain-associated membrane protein 1 isoform X2 [Macrosteles quadrilineatus]|uniref:translocating chain-associated membrane protein 1 isoform X2 n=1 Tax=Macrosteles quadrilineatus TaxID=74068 RepID=UPI0023E2A66C|nr:translocating chain-associated membrane protein 1 isoform X2 [Macrosteles quadrilineatus]